jgi:hypothetical protein
LQSAQDNRKFCAALSNTDAQTIEKFSQSLNFFLSKCFSPKILHNMTKPDYEKKKKLRCLLGVCMAAPPKKGLGQKTCSDV